MTHFIAISRGLLAALSILVAMGCTAVLETTLLPPGGDESCQQASGVYHPPKRSLRTKVTGSAPTLALGLEVLPAEADTRYTFCLDYLNSATSTDRVVIQRTADGLLRGVYSNVTDQSGKIALKILEILQQATLGSVVGTSRSAARVGPEGTLASFEFDPFDPKEAALVNDGLRPYGFCVLIGDPNLDKSPASRCAEFEQRQRVSSILPSVTTIPVLPAARNGILYRANRTYEVIVMRKLDPTLRGGWQTYITRQVEMPNEGPIFSIGVDRSLFVKRNTVLSFNDGVLTDITIDKESELSAFVDIPLQIAQTVVAIPAQLIAIRTNEAENRLRLIQVQGELIRTQRAFQNELARSSTVFTGTRGASDISRTNVTRSAPMEESSLAAVEAQLNLYRRKAAEDHCQGNRECIQQAMECLRSGEAEVEGGINECLRR